jgi:hypothetical protein
MESRKGKSIVNQADIENLTNVLQTYQVTAGSNPIQLRLALPAKELWRLFIERDVQEHGRNVKEILDRYKKVVSHSPLFQNPSYFKETLMDLVQKDDELNRILLAKNWLLTEEEGTVLTLEKLLQLDKAWIPFERNEKGYIESLYLAFLLAMDLDKKMDAELIKSLHKTSVSKVENTLCSGKENADVAGQYRKNQNASVGLSRMTTTVAGIQQILESDNDDVFIGVPLFKGDKHFFLLNKKILQLIQSDVFSFDDFYYESEGASEKNIKEVRSRVDLLTKEFKSCPSQQALAEKIMQRIQDNEVVKLLNMQDRKEQNLPIRKCIHQRFERILAEYQKELKQADSAMDKLTAIVKFVQHSAHLHPFRDANCRSIYILGLNHELLANGFPLAFLDDANRFEGYSLSEMAREVIKGMNNTFELIEKKKLFNVATDDICTMLKHNAEQAKDPILKTFYQNQLDYFDKTVAIEETARQQLKDTPQLR